MGLNPGSSAEQLQQKILDDNFNGGSPYYSMYHCGYYGVPIEKCLEKCQRNGIAVRKKDIQSYNDGVFKRGMGYIVKNNQLVDVSQAIASLPLDKARLTDFPLMPIGWTGSERRFFPCTKDNKPMGKWGWAKKPDGSVYVPKLYTRVDAQALSPCGWVGHNLLYQRFIVMDIDGRGHGNEDLEVIAFGNQFRDYTFTVEDPAKPGSFHLYFETDRLIPIRHFVWAKLDLMGNAANAAVYFKNKVGNGVPMAKLDDNIWHAMMEYQKKRKEGQYV